MDEEEQRNTDDYFAWVNSPDYVEPAPFETEDDSDEQLRRLILINDEGDTSLDWEEWEDEDFIYREV